MKRVQSLDMIRGFCIFLMVLGHLLDWWMGTDRWVVFYIFSIIASIAATGFLFISGFSAAIAYKSRAKKAETSTDITMTQARNIYIIRALLLLVIALIYNTVVALGLSLETNSNEMKWIWAWNVLQTISISLLLAWPLLRTPKYLRIGLGIGLLIVNELLFPFLLSYIDQLNIFGVLFHLLYHPDEAFTILAYFAIFIIGTVVGDFLFNINSIKDQEERKKKIKQVFIRTILIVGIILFSFGIIYRIDRIDFISRPTLSAMFYSIGFVLILLAILLYLEEFEKIKLKKRYRFFFYYSFYSFTIYIAHDPLYYIFFRQLNALNIWLVIFVIFVLTTLLLKVLHKKVGLKASLKAQLGILSLTIANKIEQRKSRK